MGNILFSSVVGGYVMVISPAVDGHVIRCPHIYEFSSVKSSTNPIASDSFVSLYFKFNHCIFHFDRK